MNTKTKFGLTALSTIGLTCTIVGAQWNPQPGGVLCYADPPFALGCCAVPGYDHERQCVFPQPDGTSLSLFCPDDPQSSPETPRFVKLSVGLSSKAPATVNCLIFLKTCNDQTETCDFVCQPLGLCVNPCEGEIPAGDPCGHGGTQ